ncbi:hypothetical protein HLM50_08505 [Sulfitobacter sp. Ks41]|uniref:HTH-like domain-containing protein n=1 Tax=Sulfitobacter sp. Ks41 TaxID=2731139 RepID=UPI0023E1B981|nr:hypothetical protein [Sulfitobacter sp. Ks41]MDF3361104.1 hypothetical protein [Sulfitobacter sp. Ks41]
MRTADLANTFADRYHNAAERQVVVSIHLFGIEFAEQLKGQNIQEICKLARVPKSYGTEIRKGMRLAPHVELKK